MSEPSPPYGAPTAYRTRSRRVVAVRWTGDRAAVEAVLGLCPKPSCSGGDALYLRAPRPDEYGAIVEVGDWLVARESGEIVKMSNDSFLAMYEPEPAVLDAVARAIYGVLPNGTIVKRPSTSLTERYHEVLVPDTWEDAPDRHEDCLAQATAALAAADGQV